MRNAGLNGNRPFDRTWVHPRKSLQYDIQNTAPEQIGVTDRKFGMIVGLTVMVYVEGDPVQPFRVGITVIVAKIGTIPVFIAVNPGIFPIPLLPKPIAVFEFVQVYDAPAGELENVAAGIKPLLHTIMFAGTITVGV